MAARTSAKNGSVIAGSVQTPGTVYYYTNTNGSIQTYSPNDMWGSQPTVAGLSGDGQRMAGTDTFLGTNYAFVHTAGGKTNLGDLAGGVSTSAATGISSDGDTVVGQGCSAAGLEALARAWPD